MITGNGAQEILKSMRVGGFRYIEHLNLGDNPLGGTWCYSFCYEIGVLSLSELNFAIEWVGLENTHFDRNASLALIESLKVNTSLKVVLLKRNSLDLEVLAEVDR